MNEQQPPLATPWHLWVVGGLLLIWNGTAVFDYIATMIRYEPYLSGYPEEALDYYFSAPVWMYFMWGISSFGGFLSAVFLLLRRKIAVPIGAVAWICSLIAAIYTYINPAPVGGDIMFYIIVLIAALLIILYMVWLSRRAVLQ